jgi:sugar phosphate isomerase/epimerase
VSQKTRRREFLLCSAAAVGAPALEGSASAAGGGPKLGCVTYNLLKDFDLQTIIKLLETAGFDGVELRTEHKHGIEPSIDAGARSRVRKSFEASKVRLVSYGTTCEFHSPDAAVRSKNVEIGRQFVDLAHDTGAMGIKVRPNGLPKELSVDETVKNIASSLKELGDYGGKHGIEVWLEVHGRGTNSPAVVASIMKETRHPSVGVCWNSNAEEVVNGSVKQNFDLLKPWIKHVHINELGDARYPWRELFGLLRAAGYNRYTLAEVQENPQTERFLRWYKALWTEFNRSCA